MPYAEFLTLPLAQLAEGKGRDELLFATAHRTCLSRDRGTDGSRSQCATLRASTTPSRGSHRTTSDTPPRALRCRPRAHVKAVQRMLGHSSAAMTLEVYADLFEDDLDQVAAALDAAKRRSFVVTVLSRT